jgi:hypothetical protein
MNLVVFRYLCFLFMYVLETFIYKFSWTI